MFHSTTEESTVAVYPSSPPLEPLQGREADARDVVIPAIFSTPFESEVADNVAGHGSLLSTGNTLTTMPASPETADRSLPPQPNTQEPNPSDTANKGNSTKQTVANGGMYMLVQWLDLFFSHDPAWSPVFPLFEQGLSFSTEIVLPFHVAMPPLPPPGKLQAYTALFFDRFSPVFPIVDRTDFEECTSNLQLKLAATPMSSLQPKDYPLLAITYGIFSLAADEEAEAVTVEGTQYLEAAYSLYGHLVALPYVSSVQALLLLSLILRTRNKDGASWSILGQAVRTAQSLGLHRHAPQASSCDQSLGNLNARIWWAAYIMERTMELETGRPSAIRDDECDQIVPHDVINSQGRRRSSSSFDYFNALIRLAKIKTRAIQLLYGNRHKRKPLKDMLIEMGKIDRALLDWASTFPESIRPGRDIFCGASELHLATYVGLQYHQTMMELHRQALLSAVGFLRNRINEHCTGTPWRDRLHFSLCIGVASARATLKAFNDLLMYTRPSRLITANQVLLATLVIGIYVTKVPMSRMNHSDVANATNSEAAIQVLRKQLRKSIETQNSTPAITGESRDDSAILNPESLLNDVDMQTNFEGLEESWAYMWSEDFATYLANTGEQDTASMYLLGIPSQS